MFENGKKTLVPEIIFFTVQSLMSPGETRLELGIAGFDAPVSDFLLHDLL